MNKYFVIHSKDPWLLARLATELMMEGKELDEYWCNVFNPFARPLPCLYMRIGEPLGIEFHNHRCYGNPTRLTLTASSYNNVLKEIIYGK